MLRKSAVEECVLHKRENNWQRLTVMPKHNLGCWTAAHLSCCMETWGATLTGRQSITRLTQTDLTCLSLDCGREPRVHGEHSHGHNENTQTPHSNPVDSRDSGYH